MQRDLPALPGQAGTLVEQFGDASQAVVLDRDLAGLRRPSVHDVRLRGGADARRCHPADLRDHVLSHPKVIRSRVQQPPASLMLRIAAGDRRHERPGVDEDRCRLASLRISSDCCPSAGCASRCVPAHRRLAQVGLEPAAQFGFALAGGYAVQEHGLIQRPSEDVDLFTGWDHRADFADAVQAVAEAYRDSGYRVDVVQQFDTFARLSVLEVDQPDRPFKVELAANWRANPPVVMDIGPVLHPDEVMAGKMSALYTRAEPRDFLDVDAAITSGRYSRERLCALAEQADAGFDRHLLADVFARLDRYPDRRWLPTARRLSTSRRFVPASSIGAPPSSNPEEASPTPKRGTWLPGRARTAVGSPRRERCVPRRYRRRLGAGPSSEAAGSPRDRCSAGERGWLMNVATEMVHLSYGVAASADDAAGGRVATDGTLLAGWLDGVQLICVRGARPVGGR